MSEKPSSAAMAAILREQLRIISYRQDPFQFDAARGVYVQRSPGWLHAEIHDLLMQVVGDDFSARYVEEVAKCLHNLSFLNEKAEPPCDMDGMPMDVFTCANGLLDLSSLRAGGRPVLLPHSPSIFCTAASPAAFDLEAACPKWLEFLAWLVGGRAAEVELIREYAAWPLISSWLRLERVMWLCGPGGNGKSLALRVLRHVLGEGATSAISIDVLLSSESFKLQSLLYKRANFCLDATVRPRASVAPLNGLISGDPQDVNRKYRDKVPFEPTAVHFFASNEPPAFADASDAWWRRLLLLDCSQRLTPLQRNPLLFDELVAEKDGILAWLVAALPALVARKRFDVPETVQLNVLKLKNEAVAARQFCAERLVKSDDAESFISGSVLMGEFKKFCESVVGVRVEPLRTMKQEIKKAFDIEWRRSRRGVRRAGPEQYGWLGLAWSIEPTSDSVALQMQNDALRERNDLLRKELAEKAQEAAS
jgi:P4 family phage/plasmid primase-like protien